jgi:hypothetical protein
MNVVAALRLELENFSVYWEGSEGLVHVGVEEQGIVVDLVVKIVYSRGKYLLAFVEKEDLVMP